MIELPEAIALGRQVNEALSGKTITNVFDSNSPHRFTFFYGNPLAYRKLLVGRKIISAQGNGIFVDIILEEDIKISFNDGVNIRHGNKSSPIPNKYQLLLTFDDESFLVFTVAMYGGIAAYQGEFDNIYYFKSIESVSPMDEKFNRKYFNDLIDNEPKDISLKALLATEQRIPGIGNGVLQDILLNAFLHPKRKIHSLTDAEKENLFQSIKSTLQMMVENGGRDTEKDLYGKTGGYKTLLSKNTYKDPCPKCGGVVCKENYMGGSIYYCSTCQEN